MVGRRSVPESPRACARRVGGGGRHRGDASRPDHAARGGAAGPICERRVRAALANVVALRADVTANDEADRELMRRLGVLGPPAILFFAPDRSERRRYRLFGFEGADDFSLRVEGETDAA